MQKYIVITAIALLFSQLCFSQTGRQNYVLIKPTDTEKEIIAKAASVTPSLRRLRCYLNLDYISWLNKHNILKIAHYE